MPLPLLGQGWSLIKWSLHLLRGSPQPRPLPNGNPVLWPTSPMGFIRPCQGMEEGGSVGWDWVAYSTGGELNNIYTGVINNPTNTQLQTST